MELAVTDDPFIHGADKIIWELLRKNQEAEEERIERLKTQEEKIRELEEKIKRLEAAKST